MATSAVGREVSGPTIFWALVPIAVNSMTQPAGSPKSSASKSFCDRSSPLFCLCDAGLVLVRYAFYVARLQKPILAARFVARERLDEVIVPKELRSIQDNSIVRALLFTFGALPQTVKLFSCQGVGLVQAIAAMYLVSFIILEILIVTPGRLGELNGRDLVLHARTQSEAFEHFMANLKVVSGKFEGFVLLGLCAAWLFSDPFLFFGFEDVEVGLGESQVLILLISLTLVTLFGLFLHYRARVWGTQTKSLLLMTALCAMLRSDCTPFYIPMWVIATIPVYSMGYITWKLVVSREVNNPTTFHWISTSLIVWIALAYFMYLYDPAGTIKPAWTEYLG